MGWPARNERAIVLLPSLAVERPLVAAPVAAGRLREHRSQAPALVMAAHLLQLLAEATAAMFVV